MAFCAWVNASSLGSVGYSKLYEITLPFINKDIVPVQNTCRNNHESDDSGVSVRIISVPFTDNTSVCTVLATSSKLTVYKTLLLGSKANDVLAHH